VVHLVRIEVLVRGDEDDGHLDAPLAQLHQEPGAVEHGHHQVEHHDIERLLLHQLQRHGAVLRGGDRVGVLEQQDE
jgi:hypothetical protein